MNTFGNILYMYAFLHLFLSDCACMVTVCVHSASQLTFRHSRTRLQREHRAPSPIWRPSGCLWIADPGFPPRWSPWFRLVEAPSQGITAQTRPRGTDIRKDEVILFLFLSILHLSLKWSSKTTSGHKWIWKTPPQICAHFKLSHPHLWI